MAYCRRSASRSQMDAVSVKVDADVKIDQEVPDDSEDGAHLPVGNASASFLYFTLQAFCAS